MGQFDRYKNICNYFALCRVLVMKSGNFDNFMGGLD